MAFKQHIKTDPIVDKSGWKLSFQWVSNSVGMVGEHGSTGFTCAAACLANVNISNGTISGYSHLGPSPVPEDVRHRLYAALVELFKENTYMVQVCGVVNGGTDARLKHYLQSENKHGYHTYDLMNYLIANQIGVVVETPVFVNTYHKWEGPSICQGWFWFSPSILEQGALLQHTGAIHGLENVKKFLTDSPINHKNVGTFDGLLAKPLVEQPRFAKARETWDNYMKDKGLLKVPEILKEKVKQVGELWQKKVV